MQKSFLSDMNLETSLISGSEEEYFKDLFTIYGLGCHLGDLTWTIYISFRSPFYYMNVSVLIELSQRPVFLP